MYFATGWPRSYRLFDTVAGASGHAFRHGEAVLYLRCTARKPGHVVLVTTTTVQVWSGGEHRVRLGEHVRDKASIAESGVNFKGHWNDARGVLVVLTAANRLHLYQVRVGKANAAPIVAIGGAQPDANAYAKVDVLLFHTVCLDALPADEKLAVAPAAAQQQPPMFTPPPSPLHAAAAAAAATSPAATSPTPLSMPNDAQQPADHPDSPVQCTALASDRAYLYVACADGGVVAFAWRHVVHGGHGDKRVRWDPMLLHHRGPAVRQLDVGLGNKAPEDSQGNHHNSLAAAVLADGRCALLRYSPNVTADRDARISLLCWLPLGQGDVGPKAVTVAFSPNGHLLAVGGSGGETALFDVTPLLGLANDAATPTPRVTCVLTLADWGHAPSDHGPVSCLRWSPLGDAVAVGWHSRGLALWSTSGCRLLCTVRQASASTTSVIGGRESDNAGSPLPSSPKASVDGWAAGAAQRGFVSLAPPAEPLESGVAAICWGMHGYNVLAASHWHGALRPSGVQCFVQFSLARCVWDRKHVDAGSDIKHLLLGADRLLFVDAHRGSDDGSALAPQPFLRHVCVPPAYRASAWPMRVCASSPDGTDVVVAGAVGLALYSRRGAGGVAAGGGGWTVGAGGGAASGGSWRVFGDVSQERSLTAHMLAWMPRVVCAVVHSRSPLPAPRGLKKTPMLTRVGFCDDASAAGAGSNAGVWSLVFYPRYHLDHASLLAQVRLPEGCPSAIDTAHGHLLVAHAGSAEGAVSLLTCRVVGRLTPLGTPKVEVRAVLEVAPCQLPPPIPSPAHAIRAVALLPPRMRDVVAKAAHPDAEDAMPEVALVLRMNGALSLLQLGSGREFELGRGVEMAWVTEEFAVPTSRAGADVNAPVTPRPPDTPHFGHPIWSYGRLGVQVWYPDSLERALDAAAGPRLAATASAAAPAPENSAVSMDGGSATVPPEGAAAAAAAVVAEDEAALRESELEFDREVYPLGPAPAPGCLVGISQRVVSSSRPVPQASIHGSTAGDNDDDDDVQPGSPPNSFSRHALASETVLYDPHPRAQPTLPCLLRHLVRRGALEEATRLACMQQRAEHFTHSLEWLLFTALRGVSFGSSDGGNLPSSGTPTKARGIGLAPAAVLEAAAALVLSFPVAPEVVVAVARKTDEREWVRLFGAAGSPLTLFERCLSSRRFRTAAGYLIVIEKLQGASAWRVATLRLLECAALLGTMDGLGLAHELASFLDRAATASETAEHIDDVDRPRTEANSKVGHGSDGWLLRALGLGGGAGEPSRGMPTAPAPLGAGEQPLPASPELARLAGDDGAKAGALAAGARAFLKALPVVASADGAAA